MKKYVKPELFYEHFELSTYIANCTFEPDNLGTPESCEFIGDVGSDWSGDVVFIQDICDMVFEGPTCYFPGADGVVTTFAS